MDFNPYKILNVDQNADVEFITNAYRYLSKKNHPDVNNSPDAPTRMRDINRAYDMLKDPSERRKIDDQLAKEALAGTTRTQTRYSDFSGGIPNNPPRPDPTPRYSATRPSSSTSNSPFDQFRSWTNRWGQAEAGQTAGQQARPTPPSDKTLYLFKKSLVDDLNQKTLRVSVYYETSRGDKICEIFSSAPDLKGKLISGSVYFRSEELFDFVTEIEEALRVFDTVSSSIEVQADHVIFWRKTVQGLSKTFLGLEIIKRNNNNAREGLLLLGGKTPSGGIEGVAAPQTAKQLQQLGRIMSEALVAMRG